MGPVSFGLVTFLATLVFSLCSLLAFLSFSLSRNGLSVRHCAVLVRLDVFFIGALAFGSFRMSSILDTVAALDDVSMLEVLLRSEELVSSGSWRVRARDQKPFLDLKTRYEFCKSHSLPCSEKVLGAMPS